MNADDLLMALDEVLDIEAGLADLTLATRATALDDVLDIEAGLVAIAPTTAATSLVDYAVRFARQPAPTRLAARTWFPSDDLVALARLLTAAAAFFEAGNHPVPEVATDTMLLLRPALTLIATRRPTGPHRLVVDHAAHLCQAVLSFRAFATLLTPVGFEPIRGVRLLRIRFERVRMALSEAAHPNTRLSERIERLSEDLRGHLRRERLAELPHAANAFRDELLRLTTAAVVRAVAVSRTLMSPKTDRRFSTLVAVADGAELSEAVSLMERALCDATHADLSGADLSDIPLVGVLWSSRTRWPAHLADDIRARSERVEPDLWRITEGETRLRHTT